MSHPDSRAAIKVTSIGASSPLCNPDSLHILLCGRVNAIQVTGVFVSANPPLATTISCTELYSYLIHHFYIPPILYRLPNVISQTFRQPLATVEEVAEHDGSVNNLARLTWLEATMHSNRLVDRIGEVAIESTVTAHGDLNFRLISEVIIPLV